MFVDLHREASRDPLDIGDASALSPEERAAALSNWRQRMVSEHVSARVFAGFFDRMMRAGLPRRFLDMARVGIDEELSHAVLCARVVTALGGEARAPLPVPLPRVERHEDASPIEAVLRDAISIGALSETVAVALVGAEREQTASNGLHAVLNLILADEVGHSRLGWCLLDELLPGVDARTRKRLSAYLAGAFEHQIDFHSPFLDMPPTSDVGAAFGAPDGPANWQTFVDTMTQISVPGLAERGLAARLAWSTAVASVRARGRRQTSPCRAADSR